MTAPGQITDTPIFDGVLGDLLAAARRAVGRAEQDAREFRAALSRSTAAALEQQAEQRARALLEERTAQQEDRTRAIESRLRATEDLLATRDRELATATSELAATTVALDTRTAELATLAAERAAPAPPVSSAPPELAPGRVTVARQVRRSDDGPKAADVPSVPSMKDIFATTRAAGWLSDLRAGKRPV